MRFPAWFNRLREPSTYTTRRSRGGGTVYTSDSKSDGRKAVRVRIPPPGPEGSHLIARRRFTTLLLVTVAMAALALPFGGISNVAAAGAPTKLAFLLFPDDDIPYADQAFDLVVGIVDPSGEVVTQGVSATVTLGLVSTDAPGAFLTCPSGLTKPTVASGTGAGTATFTGCTFPAAVDRPEQTTFYYADLTATASNVVSTTMPSPMLAPARETVVVTPRLGSIKLTTRHASPFTWGQTLTVRVQFTRAGANQPFRLEQTNRERTTWWKLADLTTDANGLATFSHRPSVSTVYRVVFGGNAELPAGTSDRAEVLVFAYAKQVPTQTTPRVIRRGTTVTFSTTIRPILPDMDPAIVWFRLYHRVAGVWKLASSRFVTVDSAGVGRLNLRFVGRGEWYVRSHALGRWIGDPVSEPAVVLPSRPTPIARYSVR